MSKTVKILYKNWKGITSWRKIIPEQIVFGSNEWYKEEQWLLEAHDVTKDATRNFAMQDIQEWVPQ
jgi:predicted DNA-binding transcriptional regulator YafY